MHVCHLSDGAVESDYFKNIAAGLSQNGVRVSIIQLKPGNAPRWLADVPGVSYLSLGADLKLHYPMAALTLARFLKKDNVDILHAHLFFSGLIALLAKLLHRKTIVALMRHHTSGVRMFGSRLHIAADKWMAENADRVMTVSRAARDYMIGVDGIRRNDIEVVYLGFDFDKMSPNIDDRKQIRHEFGFADGDLVIGYVGTIAKGKGHIQLIQAFAKIVERIPHAKLFLVGGGMLDEVKEAAANFSSRQIVFAGWRDDVSACLNATDIFVQPSLSEAFSQVLVEAMGAGLPVIATRVGGAGEVVDSGINGILVDPNEIDAIAEKVGYLYMDKNMRDQIAAAGRETVTERFTINKVVDRHLELYHRWMSARDTFS